MAWVTGDRLQGGKYTIERELGRGRFGITYVTKLLLGNGVDGGCCFMLVLQGTDSCKALLKQSAQNEKMAVY